MAEEGFVIRPKVKEHRPPGGIIVVINPLLMPARGDSQRAGLRYIQTPYPYRGTRSTVPSQAAHDEVVRREHSVKPPILGITLVVQPSDFNSVFVFERITDHGAVTHSLIWQARGRQTGSALHA